MLSWAADILQIALSADTFWKGVALVCLAYVGTQFYQTLRALRAELAAANKALVKNGQPVDLIGEVAALLGSRNNLFEQLICTQAECKEAQTACIALHKKFFESPDLLCRKFKECPAIQDSNERSRETNENVAEMKKELTEFLKNTGVQVMRLAEIATGVIQKAQKND